MTQGHSGQTAPAEGLSFTDADPTMPRMNSSTHQAQNFWDRLEALAALGIYPDTSRPARRQCAVCGSFEHNRRAHGWSGRNMDGRTARQLAAARCR